MQVYVRNLKVAYWIWRRPPGWDLGPDSLGGTSHKVTGIFVFQWQGVASKLLASGGAGSPMYT